MYEGDPDIVPKLETPGASRGAPELPWELPIRGTLSEFRDVSEGASASSSK